MILNSVDQLGNAYCHQLAALGFDIILCGSDVDSERMENQSQLIQERYKVRTFILNIDYTALGERSEDYYQEIGKTLTGYDICILINNQTYSVPFDLA